ncbi:MAG: 2,3-bisphosphoglycerate-independent phosphoglycerate mutase, partial [bacterium]|nr:2,3-bisphosphoglycerate-independent phosphoglycerate mutase [bacterium]
IEQMVDSSGHPHTAHTLSTVPFILITPDPLEIYPSGKLADIGPTILELMGLEKPSVMTGHSLIKEECK